MRIEAVFPIICVNLFALCEPNAAAAQEAAESAVLEAGTVAPQAGAARSLAGAISGSLRAAGDSLGMPAAARGGSSRGPVSARPYSQAYAIPANIDPLAGTDAPAYRILGSRAVIRVAFGLDQSPAAICIAYCR